MRFRCLCLFANAFCSSLPGTNLNTMVCSSSTHLRTSSGAKVPPFSRPRFLPKKISRLVIMNLTFLPAFCWVLECKAVDCSLLGTYASDWNRHSLPASFAQLLLGTKRPKGARNPAACGSWVSQIVNVHMKRVQIDLTNIILSFPGACQTLQPLDRNDESASKPLPVRHSTWFPKEPEEIHTNLLNLSI